MTLPYTLIRPIITEKSMLQTAANKYTFEVDVNANKNQIKEAVEKTFAVEVVSVETTKVSGKRRRIGRLRREIRKTDSKKAIVKLKPGQKIDLFEIKT